MRIFGLSLLALVGCTASPAGQPISLQFAGTVGDAPFACGGTYEGIGTSGTTFTGYDFRFYVHDVRVVTSDGEEIPVTLDDDGTWQNGEVALLDFETGGECMSGNAPTNDRVLGTVDLDADQTLVALRFRLGVPEHLNHLNAAAQPPPLNTTSLFWGWSAGYDFLRVDGRTTEQPFVTMLLGAMGCTGDARMGTRTCAVGNRAEVSVPMTSLLDLERGVIVADLRELFATTDMSRNAGGPEGCMSDASDPECVTMFASLGMSTSGDPVGEQRFFRYEAAP